MRPPVYPVTIPVEMLTIRAARATDVALLRTMIRELAEFERQLELVTIQEKDLLRDGFGPYPKFRALIAEWDGQPSAYALFYDYYSTWVGRGLYLEDLFVREQFRRKGIGKALLAAGARIARDEHYWAMRWEVLDWNTKAIDLYRALGAEFRDEWRSVLLTGGPLWRVSRGSHMTVRVDKVQVAAPVRLFRSQEAWAKWLEKNHRKSKGLWLRLAKKDSGLRSVSYSEALDIALCYGWIDGQKRGESEQAWLQRFVPRSASSIWSKINREKALALIKSGHMHSAGMEAVEVARKNGRWKSAYDSPKGAEVPEDLRRALEANRPAREFFESLDSANRYAILFRIQTVKKAATRSAKICQFVEMLGRNERIHEPRTARQSK